MFSMYYYGWINGWMIEWLHGDGWMDIFRRYPRIHLQNHAGIIALLH